MGCGGSPWRLHFSFYVVIGTSCSSYIFIIIPPYFISICKVPDPNTTLCISEILLIFFFLTYSFMDFNLQRHSRSGNRLSIKLVPWRLTLAFFNMSIERTSSETNLDHKLMFFVQRIKDACCMF